MVTAGVGKGGEGWEEGVVRELEINMNTPLYLKWVTNKDLAYSTREHCSMLCGSLDGRGVWGRMDPVAVHVRLKTKSFFFKKRRYDTDIQWNTTQP